MTNQNKLIDGMADEDKVKLVREIIESVHTVSSAQVLSFIGDVFPEFNIEYNDEGEAIIHTNIFAEGYHDENDQWHDYPEEESLEDKVKSELGVESWSY